MYKKSRDVISHHFSVFRTRILGFSHQNQVHFCTKKVKKLLLQHPRLWEFLTQEKTQHSSEE
jgi:hypothetical protein